jgi:hypothetical protein
MDYCALLEITIYPIPNMKSLFYLCLFAFSVPFFRTNVCAASTPKEAEVKDAKFVNERTLATSGSQLTRSAMGIERSLQLSSFVAKAHHVSVLLSWVVDKPANEVSFIVERAFGNGNWEKVGRVTAAVGQREFSFWDVRVKPGEAYEYRLVNESNGLSLHASEPVLLQVDNPFDEYLIILGILGFIGYVAYQTRNLVY